MPRSRCALPGPGPISVFHDDDPRLQERFASKRAAEARAKAIPDLDSLFEALSDSDAYLRQFCANEISRRGQIDGRYVPRLMQLLRDDPAGGVRIEAAFAMCNVSPGAQAIEVLRNSAASDDNERVRWSARFALFQLGEARTPWRSDTAGRSPLQSPRY